MTSHPLTLRIAAGVTAATTLLGVLSLPAVAGAAPPVETAATAETVPGRIVVSWERGTSAAARAEIRGRHGAEVAERVDSLGVEVLAVPPHAAERVIAALDRQDGVAFAEPDYVMASAASDPGFDELWGLHNTGQRGGTADVDIDAPEAWEVTRGSEEIVVAVIDTGIDISHPDLAENIWVNTDEIPGNGVDDDKNGYVDDVRGWDFKHDDASVYDGATEDGHGTHVAGTIAAVGDNGTGIVGVAPNVKIMPLKFISGGTGSSLDAAEAVAYARANGATVINASWGGGGGETLRQEVAAAAGTAFVAAAGNGDANGVGINMDAAGTPYYPAAWAKDSFGMPNVVSVASITRTGSLSDFSNHGVASVDIGAPGSGIYSTVPGGYASFDGTSMAAPHAAGVAALVASLDGRLDGAGLGDAIKRSARQLDSLVKITTTGGLLDAHGAVALYATPGVPTGVVAEAGNATATVTWAAPTDGGLPTSYVVSAVPTDGVSAETTRTVAAPATSLAFDGLTNGTAYRFTVAAANGVGTSAAAEPSEAVTPTAPPTTDDGTTDSGGTDGGTSGGGTTDSGTTDGGTSDGGTTDSGTTDGGTSGGGPSGGTGGGGTAPAPAPEPVEETAPTPEPEPGTSTTYDGVGARTLEQACPAVTGSGFVDVPVSSVHALGVGCAASWGVFTGSSGGAFGPGDDLTRGQLASVLVRGIEAATGQSLPAGADHFTDDDGSVHRTAIDKLAALGIVTGVDPTTYRPGSSVTRGQFAAMLARTFRYLVGELPAGTDAFRDDDGTTHEAAIDGLAALGIVAGSTSGELRPGSALTRAQSATLVARLLDALVEAGAANPA